MIYCGQIGNSEPKKYIQLYNKYSLIFGVPILLMILQFIPATTVTWGSLSHITWQSLSSVCTCSYAGSSTNPDGRDTE